jgi:hypothetical protein
VVLVVTKAAKKLVTISVVANAVVGGSSSNSVAVAARINMVVAIGNSLLGRRCKIVGAMYHHNHSCHGIGSGSGGGCNSCGTSLLFLLLSILEH